MQIKLENEYLEVRISPIGAELKGIFSKETGKEYMWQPGKELWNHSSMLLFPNPGRINGDRVIIRGKEYPASMHGFASDLSFGVLERTEQKVSLVYDADEVSLQYLPYQYRIIIEFSIEGKLLLQRFQVINMDTEDIYFSIGYHPAFYLPLAIQELADDYVLRFSKEQTLFEEKTLDFCRLRLPECDKPYICNESVIPLNNHFFDHESMIFSGVDADTITLESLKSGMFVELGIHNFPYLCLWGMPLMPYFICIEPWCGVSEKLDSNHIWEEKEGNVRVAKDDIFERTLTYRVG